LYGTYAFNNTSLLSIITRALAYLGQDQQDYE